MKQHLIPKCQSNAGNAFGNLRSPRNIAGTTVTSRNLAVTPEGYAYYQDDDLHWYPYSNTAQLTGITLRQLPSGELDFTKGYQGYSSLPENTIFYAKGTPLYTEGTGQDNYTYFPKVAYNWDEKVDYNTLPLDEWTNLERIDHSDIFRGRTAEEYQARTGQSAHKSTAGDWEAFLALTAGLGNRVSITLDGRLLFDALDTAFGGQIWDPSLNEGLGGYRDKTFTDWSNSLIYGNNGVVSDLFAQEHPYYSMGINFAGDLILGATPPAYKYARSGKASGLVSKNYYNYVDKKLAGRLYREFSDPTEIHRYNGYENNPAIDNYTSISSDFRLGIPVTLEEFLFTSSAPKGLETSLVGSWSTPKLADVNSGSFTFMGPYGYSRSDLFATGWPRLFRMGFTASARGQKLPKVLADADRAAILRAPSGSFISADAQGITLPELMEKAGKGAFENYTPELIQELGTEGANTVLNSFFEKKVGFNPRSENPYGMSPDAYRFFTRQGQTPGTEVVYSGRAGKFNSAAVRNSKVYDWQTAYEAGELSPVEYRDLFNGWVKEFGGRKAYIDPSSGEVIIPHPTVYVHKNGGIIESKIKLKNAQ